jgi:hypothetical protein
MGERMRFLNFLNELSSVYGAEISFFDIDETLFRTFAKILVKDKKTQKTVRELDNQEFNSYKLKPGEYFDFRQFRDSEFFYKTSIPIEKTIKMVKRMIDSIENIKGSANNRIVFLTAREDFNDRDKFLSTFEKYGVKMNKPTVYVERSGNLKNDEPNISVEMAKKKIILKYINTGNYRRVRMIDDHLPNLTTFLSIEKEIPRSTIDKIKEKHNISDEETFPVIQFFALHVDGMGKLRRIK